jgi:hypothetical protein
MPPTNQQLDQNVPPPPPGFVPDAPAVSASAGNPPPPPPGFVPDAPAQTPQSANDVQPDALTKTEDFIHNAAQGVGQGTSDVWGVVKNGIPGVTPGATISAAKGIWHALPPVELADEMKQTLPVINAYEKARASGASVSDSIKASDAVARQHVTSIDTIKKVANDFRANPTKETARALTDAAAVAASFFGGGEAALGAEVELPAVAAEAAPEVAGASEVPTAADFSAASKPNIVKQIIQGKSVAQPAAQQTIREGVQTATENAGTADESVAANIKNQPLLGRNQTVVDEHLASLRGLEQDAYERMDESAGFDVKAEKAQLANDQYAIKQLGNTETDVAQKEKLTASIQDSQTRIADADAKMKDAGIDPAEADALHKQRMAGTDFRKALIQNATSDGQSINVDGLLKASKQMQFSKYGNRLEQFFGSPEAADEFMSNLEQAQKLGTKAAKAQQIAKWVGGIAATSAGVGGVVHGVTAALSE